VVPVEEEEEVTEVVLDENGNPIINTTDDITGTDNGSDDNSNDADDNGTTIE